ncbi:AraC family transcriptional regulator [Bradyrhizobium sp.]|uniref:AraC family transcriptional regulator n=1 Tax=Bradyrhizobium sp. TaxID=376 RepID=UPI003C4F611A
MPIQSSAASLSRFLLVDTHDPEIMRNTLLNHYGAKKFEARDTSDFLGQSFHAKLESASLGVTAYGTPVSIEFLECNFARLHIAIAGKVATIIGGRTTETCAAQACVTPPDRANRHDFDAGTKVLFVRIEKTALERKLAALLGARPRRPIEFSPARPDDQAHFESLKDMIAFTAKQLASTAANPPLLMLKEIEQALVVAFLETVPHSYSDALRRPPADITDTHVRRIEEYIDAHWRLPLTVEDLSRITEIGTRSIFHAFKRARGYTPVSYIKTVRLRNAHAILTSPGEAGTVTAAAYQCGFSNLGHFARDYQRTFGELPSVTLNKARHWSPQDRRSH